jgi:mono/diheme cytochrome c family protein
MLNTPLRIALALLLAVSSSSLVGCTGDDGTGDAETSESAESAETTTDTNSMSLCMNDDAMRGEAILALTPDEGAGSTVFSNSCGLSACHGADGNSGTAPRLSDEVPNYPPESLVCLLLNGTASMPAQAALSDQQLADVIAYVEASF